MTGSCPVSARVCQETVRERDELSRWKAEALPVSEGLQELGKALGLPLGSRITGTEGLDAVERLKSDVNRYRGSAALYQRLMHEAVEEWEGALDEVGRLRDLASWLVGLDDPDGVEERRTVTLTKIIDRARVALNQKEIR